MITDAANDPETKSVNSGSHALKFAKERSM